MNLFGKTFGLLLGLALMAALGWAAYLAIDYLVSLFALLDAQVAKVTAIASLVVLAAAAIVASAVRNAAGKSRAARVQEQRNGTYQFFVECWQDPATPPHKFQALERLLALYGAAAAIRAQAELRALVREKGARHPEVATRVGKALLELRRDLGAQEGGVTATELQQLVLAPQAPQA